MFLFYLLTNSNPKCSLPEAQILCIYHNFKPAGLNRTRWNVQTSREICLWNWGLADSKLDYPHDIPLLLIPFPISVKDMWVIHDSFMYLSFFLYFPCISLSHLPCSGTITNSQPYRSWLSPAGLNHDWLMIWNIFFNFMWNISIQPWFSFFILSYSLEVCSCPSH